MACTVVWKQGEAGADPGQGSGAAGRLELLGRAPVRPGLGVECVRVYAVYSNPTVKGYTVHSVCWPCSQVTPHPFLRGHRCVWERQAPLG